MRDGSALTEAGQPVIVLVHDNFGRAARAQASALGVSDLRIYAYPHFEPGDDLALEVEKARRAAHEFPKLFTRLLTMSAADLLVNTPDTVWSACRARDQLKPIEQHLDIRPARRMRRINGEVR